MTSFAASLDDSLRIAAVINAASVQAKIGFWSDELTAALRKRDRPRVEFCRERCAECVCLLYLLVENDGRVL